jgi:hypothetical protein
MEIAKGEAGKMKKRTTKKPQAKKPKAKKSQAKAKKSASSAAAKPAAAPASAAAAVATRKARLASPPQSNQVAATSVGLFLHTDDKWAAAYFDENDLHCKERELLAATPPAK